MAVIQNNRILLHLGCGPNTVKTNWIDCDGSWNVFIGGLPFGIGGMIYSITKKLNFDLHPWPSHVRHLNLKKRLPFEDFSVDAVYASHVWEHLTLFDATFTTKEYFRILKKQGIIRLVLPDVRAMLQKYRASTDENAMDVFMDDLQLRDRGSKVSLVSQQCGANVF